MFWRLIACLTPGPSRSHSWSKQISFLVQADLTPGPSRSHSSLARTDPLPYPEGEKGSGDYRQHSVSFRNFKHASNEPITVKGLVSGVVDDA